MEKERICPIHKLELRKFEGIGKESGKPYTNWKCTSKEGGKYCDYIEWPERSFNYPKKAPISNLQSEAINKVLLKQDEILKRLDAMAEYLKANVGNAYVPPKPRINEEVPF